MQIEKKAEDKIKTNGIQLVNKKIVEEAQFQTKQNKINDNNNHFNSAMWRGWSRWPFEGPIRKGSSRRLKDTS